MPVQWPNDGILFLLLRCAQPVHEMPSRQDQRCCRIIDMPAVWVVALDANHPLGMTLSGKTKRGE